MKVLVTGCAGFIGSYVAKALLERGDEVIGVDDLNDYYDPKLKKSRLKYFFEGEKAFKFYKLNFCDKEKVKDIFENNEIDKICHLGAQAGVRYSLENPYAYIKSNIEGTVVIFEMAKKYNIKKIVYASSSSVYGGNKKIPFSVEDSVDKPISLYAATKRSDELIAYTYHHLYGIKMGGLRFFTVYGPWGRPDMALFKFTKAISKGGKIDVYNHGEMKRDFTYITDIVAGVLNAIDTEYDFEIFNLGNNNPVELLYFIECIEKELGKKANKNMMPIQEGDVPITSADISKTKEILGWEPKIKIEEGIKKFVEWFNSQ